MASAAEMMVVDASVAAKWLLKDEDNVEKADLLLTRFANGRMELIAPDQIRYEVPATITVATLGTKPRISRADAYKAIERFLALGITTVNTDDPIMAAFPLVHQHTIAYYDGLYVALAQERSVPLITADNKLYQRIKSLPRVIWIGDYDPERS